MAVRARLVTHVRVRRRPSLRCSAAPRCAAGSLTVVGLGPGAPGLLTREAWDVLTTAPNAVYVRTAEHPTLRCLPASVKFHSFDEVYESSATLQDVYPQITERLLSAAKAGESVVYAVPGDPCIAEMTVRLLREAASSAGIKLRVLSAVSFLEPLLEALGIDVLPSLWVGDALDVAAAGYPPFSAATPALLTQLYSRSVASEVKLTLMAALPDEHRVALVHCAGDDPAPASVVEWLPLHAIDRSEAIAARSTLYVPPWAETAAPASFEAVLAGVARAHEALEGPWQEGDPEHGEVSAQLLAAANAAAAAAGKQDSEALQAALADVLLAVATHAQVGADDGEFSACHLLAAAAARAAALGSCGDGGTVSQPPRAPQGRGYALDDGSDDEGDDSE